MAVLIVDAEAGALLEPYAAMVEPHWVHVPLGTVTPTFDQFVARAGEIIPNQG
jgi:hypothetical protein